MNKRDFLVHGATALAGLAPLAASAANDRASRGNAATMEPKRQPRSQADWQALCGSTFGAQTPVRLSTELTLIEVRPGPSAAQLEQFTAVFDGPGHRRLPGGLHALTHDAIDPLALYLEPVASGNGRVTYQAHFSHLA